MKDMIAGFFGAKPLLPDDYEALANKYRERRQAERAAKQQRANVEVPDRRARDERRERWVAPLDR
jgi:hypothetical protein